MYIFVLWPTEPRVTMSQVSEKAVQRLADLWLDSGVIYFYADLTTDLITD